MGGGASSGARREATSGSSIVIVIFRKLPVNGSADWMELKSNASDVVLLPMGFVSSVYVSRTTSKRTPTNTPRTAKNVPALARSLAERRATDASPCILRCCGWQCGGCRCGDSSIRVALGGVAVVLFHRRECDPLPQSLEPDRLPR